MRSLVLQEGYVATIYLLVVRNTVDEDWLKKVLQDFDTKNVEYMERCETPVFEGGTSQEIVFQEVISNSATENEPLGTLAGRGQNTIVVMKML